MREAKRELADRGEPDDPTTDDPDIINHRVSFRRRPAHLLGRTRHRTRERRPHTFEGAIFAVDGALVDSPHERAWRQSFRILMGSSWRDVAANTTYTPEAFSPELYQEIMAGKPRMAGARAALERFKVPGVDARATEYAGATQGRSSRSSRRASSPPSRTRGASSSRSRRRAFPSPAPVFEERECVPNEPDPTARNASLTEAAGARQVPRAFS